MAELDVYFKVEDDVFVWNSEKAKENWRKHEIKFERACEVFYDRDVLFVDASTPEEDRAAAIGYTAEDAMLFVVHIERLDGVIRIISARIAEPREKRLYEDGE
ncbi:MAG: BrnT family toxin [Acidobacteriota bacterium]